MSIPRVRARLVGATALAFILFAILAAQCAAAPTRKLAVGVQFKGLWSDYSDTERERVLDQLAAAGVDSVRIDVSWAMLQPDGPDNFSSWGVSFVDKVINMAAERGLAPLVTLWLAPDWATGGRGERTLPINPEDFERVARWAAFRWRLQVAGWEVWNEPNDPTFMRDADPEAYVRLLAAAYTGFKAGSPTTPVIFGGTSYVDTDWVAKAYAAGAAEYFDVMGTHPYQGMADAPPEIPDDGRRETLAHVAALHALMAAHGDGDKPIWFTEFGWSTHANTAETPNWARGVSEQMQADYLVRTLRLVHDRYPWVQRVYWYTERNQATGDAHQDNFGLLTRELAPKPAFTALAAYLDGESV
jgi:hypothetical protein